MPSAFRLRVLEVICTVKMLKFSAINSAASFSTSSHLLTCLQVKCVKMLKFRTPIQNLHFLKYVFRSRHCTKYCAENKIKIWPPLPNKSSLFCIVKTAQTFLQDILKTYSKHSILEYVSSHPHMPSDAVCYRTIRHSKR
jgi:hypothetical protein